MSRNGREPPHTEVDTSRSGRAPAHTEVGTSRSGRAPAFMEVDTSISGRGPAHMKVDMSRSGRAHGRSYMGVGIKSVPGYTTKSYYAQRFVSRLVSCVPCKTAVFHSDSNQYQQFYMNLAIIPGCIQ